MLFSVHLHVSLEPQRWLQENKITFQLRGPNKKKKGQTYKPSVKTQMDKSSGSGSSSSLSVFRSGPSLHLTGALHAGVLSRNRRRHHGQDALRRLTVTVQTGGTGRARNAGCTGNTTGPPLSVTTVFAVSCSTGFTWKKKLNEDSSEHSV